MVALMFRRWTTGIVCASAFCTLVTRAEAQEAMGAEVLFNDGVALMKAGDYDRGCPKIAESQRLEPRAGTLFTLAECLNKQGRSATALARYEEYLRVFSRLSAEARGKQRGREKIAEAQRVALAPKVPQLKLELPTDAPAGARVEKDGVELGEASFGSWLPVDPGEHIFVVKTPNGGRQETKTTLAPGDKRELTLELPPAGKSVPPITADPTEHTGGKTKQPQDRTLAWVALGIGGAGLVASAVTGAMVLSKKSTIDENCEDTACNTEGKSAADSAQTLALISTVSFAVGVVGIGAGTWLMLGAGKDGAESHASVSLRGNW
jgi:hypothetical protein